MMRAMTGLVAKEARGLLPWAGFLGLLEAIEVSYVAFAEEFVDLLPISAVTSWLGDGDARSVVVLLVTFALSQGLLMRERDDGTLQFLDGLPTSRTAVLTAKVFAAFSLFLLYQALQLALVAALHAVSRTSVDLALPWGVLLTSLGLHGVQALLLLAFSLALSPLRRLAWLVLMLVFILYGTTDDQWLLDLVNPMTLVEPHLVGSRWVVPWGSVGAQLGLSTALLGWTWAVFLMGERLVEFRDRIVGTMAGRSIVAVASVAVIFTTICTANGVLAEETEVSSFIQFQELGTTRTETARYDAVYLAGSTHLAEDLLVHADADFDRVATFLGCEPGAHVVLDLTGSPPRTAGVARWSHIQMRLLESRTTEEHRAVLAHETTHVIIDRITDRRLKDDPGHARFFHEGLAEYVEESLFRSHDELAGSRRHAAALLARNPELSIEVLVDNAQLVSEFDTDAVYPLGSTFVAALVDLYGPEAPGRVLRAVGRDDAPDLSGLELWWDAFQHAGMAFDGVVDHWLGQLEPLRTGWEDLDTLHATVEEQDGLLVVVMHGDPGRRTRCRVRSAADAPPTAYERSAFHLVDPKRQQDAVMRCVVGTGAIRDGWVDLQLGWEVSATDTAWERWRRVRVNR